MKHFQISDELWTRLASHLPEYKSSAKGGRPRLELKKVFEGILFIKGNRIPWRGMDPEYGSKTAINDYYRLWEKSDIFKKWKEAGLLSTPELQAITLE